MSATLSLATALLSSQENLNILRLNATQFITPTLIKTPLVTANKQYTATIPAKTRRFFFQCRPKSTGLQYNIRYAFQANKVATPTNPYTTLISGQIFDVDGFKLKSNATVYFATPGTNVIVEIAAWI